MAKVPSSGDGMKHCQGTRGSAHPSMCVVGKFVNIGRHKHTVGINLRFVYILMAYGVMTVWTYGLYSYGPMQLWPDVVMAPRAVYTKAAARKDPHSVYAAARRLAWYLARAGLGFVFGSLASWIITKTLKKKNDPIPIKFLGSITINKCTRNSRTCHVHRSCQTRTIFAKVHQHIYYYFIIYFLVKCTNIFHSLKQLPSLPKFAQLWFKKKSSSATFD